LFCAGVWYITCGSSTFERGELAVTTAAPAAATVDNGVTFFVPLRELSGVYYVAVRQVDQQGSVEVHNDVGDTNTVCSVTSRGSMESVYTVPPRFTVCTFLTRFASGACFSRFSGGTGGTGVSLCPCLPFGARGSGGSLISLPTLGPGGTAGANGAALAQVNLRYTSLEFPKDS
jgi:hypothetical protein